MTDYIHKGEALTLTAPVGGVKSGQEIFIGDLLVVPLVDAEATEQFAAHVVWVWAFRKLDDEAIGQGQSIYWNPGDAGGGISPYVTTNPAGSRLIGFCAGSAAADDTSVLVKLVHVPGLINRGDFLAFTAPAGGVTKGTPVLIESMLVIPLEDAEQTETFTGQITGVHSVPKVSTDAINQGASVYWSSSANKVTTTSGGNTLVGKAAAAAGNPSDEVEVKLAG